jgi:hypothetical protein
MSFLIFKFKSDWIILKTRKIAIKNCQRVYIIYIIWLINTSWDPNACGHRSAAHWRGERRLPGRHRGARTLSGGCGDDFRERGGPFAVKQ